MDRRGFFKALAGTALAAAVLPEIWTPAKAIFLPPRGGWFQTPLRMREVRQYMINNDTLPMRYDVAWDAHQFHVDFPQIPVSIEPKVYEAMLKEQRLIARAALEQIRRQYGFNNATQRALPLPRGIDWARYV